MTPLGIAVLVFGSGWAGFSSLGGTSECRGVGVSRVEGRGSRMEDRVPSMSNDRCKKVVCIDVCMYFMYLVGLSTWVLR